MHRYSTDIRTNVGWRPTTQTGFNLNYFFIMERLQCIIIYIVLFVCIGLTENKTCNALSSYVQVTSPLDKARTILSAQALFAPYNYYVPSTELVVLTKEIDDICSGNLATDVRNKIVLIVPANGNCSYIERVYGAEINGAKAVLIASADVQTGSIEPIIDSKPIDNDGSIIITSIPVRMIPSNDADFLSLEIEIDANPSSM